MFCANVVVLEALGFLLSKTQDFPGSLCEFVEPIFVVHLLSPPFQWQRVEPSPLCRSGKLRTSSYNTHHMASRITTLASRLIEIRSELLTLYNLIRKQSTPPLQYSSVYAVERSSDQLFRCNKRNQLRVVYCSGASVSSLVR